MNLHLESSVPCRLRFILFAVKGAFRCFSGKCNALADTNVDVLRASFYGYERMTGKARAHSGRSNERQLRQNPGSG
jgi:hypothetical protein